MGSKAFPLQHPCASNGQRFAPHSAALWMQGEHCGFSDRSVISVSINSRLRGVNAY